MFSGGDVGRHSLRPIPLVLLLLGLGLFAVVRWQARSDDFCNNDVAGIAYNADVILRGGVPYRDTVEFKSPGSFFLFAAIFAVDRSLNAVRAVLVLWFLLGAVGIWKAARALYEDSLSPAVATALYLTSVGHFGDNYSSWMAVPFVWAFAAMLVGLRRGGLRWHVLAGASAILAFLFKTPAAVLGPVFLLVLAWWKWRESRHAHGTGACPPVDVPRTVVAWLVGGVLVALPILTFYALHGALREFVRGVFPVGAYVGYVVRPSMVETTTSVLSQLGSFFPASSVLAVITLIMVTFRRRECTSPIFPALVFFAGSLAGGGMGGARFYDHYSVQYLGGLAILAAHPEGLTGWLASRGRRLLRVGAVATFLVLYLVEIVDSVVDRPVRFDFSPSRAANGETYAKLAGLYVRDRTCPGDTIYAWGWDAWPTYFWSDRRSPIAMYKELGLVTTPNTNTNWQPSRTFHFRPGPYADALLGAFEATPPAYFIHSDYYRDASWGGSDPLSEFADLARLLEQRYVREVTFGTIRVHARIDRAGRPVRCSGASPPVGGDPGTR